MATAKNEQRRADAERNVEAILEAATDLLGDRPAVSMAEVARAAGVVRATLYAHFPSRRELVEAVIDRAVAESTARMDEARVDEGPAPQALERMIAASWGRLTGLGALKQASEEQLSAERVHRAHAPLMERVHALVERGQASGAFRSDLDPRWLVTAYFALVHAAHDFAHASGAERDRVLAELTMSVRAVFDARS